MLYSGSFFRFLVHIEGFFPRGGQTILKYPFTTISMHETEPDLGLFGCMGDDVSSWEGMAWKEPTHGYSPIFQVFNLKNKVMDASGDRIP